MPWSLSSLIGPFGIRLYSGDDARKLAYQERFLLSDLDQQTLAYIWGDSVVAECVSLYNTNHIGIILDEIKSLTDAEPTRINVSGMKEPIARLICFIALRILVRVYDTQSRLEVWSSMDDMTRNVNRCIAQEICGWQREQLYWAEYAYRQDSNDSSSETTRYYHFSVVQYVYCKYH